MKNIDRTQTAIRTSQSAPPDGNGHFAGNGPGVDIANRQGRKLRVLFLSFQSNLSGAPRSLYNIVKHLDRNKFEPYVLFNYPGPIVKEFEVLATTYTLSQYRSLRRVPATLRTAIKPRLRHRSFRRLVNQIAPDVIYINTVGQGDSAVWSMSIDAPKVVHFHEIDVDLINQKEEWLNQLCENTAVFVGCAEAVSNSARKWLGVPNHQVVTALGAIEVTEILNKRSELSREEVRRSIGIGPDITLIGAAGKPSFRKGIDIFIDAAEKICEQRPDIHFMWVGGHDGIHAQRSIRAMRQRSKRLGERFHWVSEVEDASLYQAAMDIYVVSSRWDPLPFGMLEAMLLERPVVSFRVSGIPEAVVEGAGVLVDKVSSEGLANALSSLLDQREMWTSMGIRGSQIVKERHDIANVIRLIERTIVSAATGGRAVEQEGF
jgi:glycosyltransferase involved in cell wall biosynthesis